MSYWVGNWCWTYDPRESPATVPFDPFARQSELLAWIGEREKKRERGLVEKSRDTGLTWLCCAYALHGWLFRAGFACGFGSRKLEYVDDLGNPKSIFEKIRMLLAHLPGWMYPVGFRAAKHSCLARLVNPVNGSTITGEGGDNIGRGDRTAIYFVDEAAHLERPQKVEASLSATTRVRIDVSTPNGQGNPFWARRHSGAVEVFTFRWTDDPRKDQAWYQQQCRLYDPATVAQEIDIDYSASVDNVTIPAAWVRAAVQLDLPPSGKPTGGLDIAELGRDRSVFVARQGPVVRMPEAWGQVTTTETAHRAASLAERAGCAKVHYDVGGLGAGVRGTWSAAESPLRFRPVAVQAGGSPTLTRWPDGKSSKELFVNRRSELWWILRARFEKTYEYVRQGTTHPPEEMISIPDCPQLISELSRPTFVRTESGKVAVESKKDMRRRGVASPDYADALCLAFHPEGYPAGTSKLEVL